MMIYLVIENSGFSYEANYLNYVGYCDTLEEAKVVVAKLEAQKREYDKLKQLLDKEYDRLWEANLEEEVFEEALATFEESLGMPENRGYDDDYYYIEIKEVKLL